MDVRMFTVGPVAENTYIFRREGSDRALIIDPGDEADKLLGAIDSLGVQLDAILLTHTHFDHVGAVAPVARATGATAPTWSKWVCVSRMPSSVAPSESSAASSLSASSPGSTISA